MLSRKARRGFDIELTRLRVTHVLHHLRLHTGNLLNRKVVKDSWGQSDELFGLDVFCDQLGNRCLGQFNLLRLGIIAPAGGNDLVDFSSIATLDNEVESYLVSGGRGLFDHHCH